MRNEPKSNRARIAPIAPNAEQRRKPQKNKGNWVLKRKTSQQTTKETTIEATKENVGTTKEIPPSLMERRDRHCLPTAGSGRACRGPSIPHRRHSRRAAVSGKRRSRRFTCKVGRGLRTHSKRFGRAPRPPLLRHGRPRAITVRNELKSNRAKSRGPSQRG